jgi:hypothetical protein
MERRGTVSFTESAARTRADADIRIFGQMSFAPPVLSSVDSGVSGDAKPRDFGGETRIGVSDAGIGATVDAGVLRIRRGSERRVVGRSAGCLGWARGLELVGTVDE